MSADLVNDFNSLFYNVWIDEKDSERIGMELVCTKKECKYNPIEFMDV
jgi:hypothetical protein